MPKQAQHAFFRRKCSYGCREGCRQPVLQKGCQSVQDFSLSRKMMKNFDREKLSK